MNTSLMRDSFQWADGQLGAESHDFKKALKSHSLPEKITLHGHAAVIISGIELAHRKRFDAATVEQTGLLALRIWDAVLDL